MLASQKIPLNPQPQQHPPRISQPPATEGNQPTGLRKSRKVAGGGHKKWHLLSGGSSSGSATTMPAGGGTGTARRGGGGGGRRAERMEKRQSLSAAQRSAVSRGHRCHPEASPYRWVPAQRQAPRGSRPPAGCHRCRTPHCHLREQHREPSGTPRDHAAPCACASPSATPCHITPGRLICQQVLVIGELGVVPPPPRAPNAVGHRVLRERGLGQTPGTVGHLEGGDTRPSPPGHVTGAPLLAGPGLHSWAVESPRPARLGRGSWGGGG